MAERNVVLYKKNKKAFFQCKQDNSVYNNQAIVLNQLTPGVLLALSNENTLRLWFAKKITTQQRLRLQNYD